MHVIGNWKLNGSAALIDSLAGGLNQAAETYDNVDVVVCPPDLWIGFVQGTLGMDSLVSTGGQNCHTETNGAFTGETSATQLAELGCEYVILGHSERRAAFGETSAKVAMKAAVASDSGLRPVICVGETLEQREAGRQNEVCAQQVRESMLGLSGGWLKNAILAYEPVWAIGTGKVASVDDVAEMSAHLRQTLLETFGDDGDAVEILYGGSVNDKNAAEIFGKGGVEGALVGGASLKADAFGAIVKAASEATSQAPL